MKHGVEYAFSGEKRLFDLALANASAPVAFAAHKLLARSLNRQNIDYNPLFTQPRRGQNGQIFDIYKLRTLDDETKQPLSPLALLLRKTGMDELLQAKNIINGQMSIVGDRPLFQADYDMIMDNATPRVRDRWRSIVQPTRKGVISSFSLYNHAHPQLLPEDADLKCELDIKDVVDGCISYDAQLLVRTMGAVLLGKT